MKKFAILALLIILTGCANPVNNQNKDSNNITFQ